MKLKNICSTKEAINKMKRQPSEWEKIFVNDATDKGLQAAHAAQYQRNKQPNPNLGRRPK